jgi:polysaccharide biosynthesis/export protein
MQKALARTERTHPDFFSFRNRILVGRNRNLVGYGLNASIVFVFCLLWMPLQARSQSGPAARPPAAPAYSLVVGDQILLHVIDMDEISDKPIRIDPNGFVDIPLAGRFHASGLTLEQFKAELATRLSKYITNPPISVNLAEDDSRPVSIIGSVNTPGVHQIAGDKRLIEVLSLAGGVKDDAGSQVIVTREEEWGKLTIPGASVDPATGSSTASVPLDDLLASKLPSDNILILPNDIISIPKAEIVYVVGNVRKAGGFQLSSRPTITILQALSLAQGLDQNAAPQRAKIIRQAPGGDGKAAEIPVDITQIFAGKAPDVSLLGNDILFIPNSAAKSGSRRAVEAILQAATGVAIYRF